MKLVAKESMGKYQSLAPAAQKSESISDDKKKELTQDLKPEKGKAIQKDNKSLLHKKRESTKKGLGIS